jgi:hypothetical protein
VARTSRAADTPLFNQVGDGVRMPAHEDGPDSLEGMAFQLLLQKVTGLERSMQSIPPLLKKIIDQLEAQTTHPEAPVATYAQLYPELQDAVYEAEALPLLAEAPAPAPSPPRRSRCFWRWFTREA